MDFETLVKKIMIENTRKCKCSRKANEGCYQKNDYNVE